MCAEDYGVRETIRAADAVTCRCQRQECALTAPKIPVRWTEQSRIEKLVEEQSGGMIEAASKSVGSTPEA